MKRNLRHLIMPALAAVAMPFSVLATSVASTDTEGSFHCFRGMPVSEINHNPAPQHHIMRAIDKLGDSKWDNTDGHDLREVRTEGVLRVLVIMVNFDDTKFSQGRPNSYALINEMLNGENFTYQNATGSAKKYYQTTSNGLFNPQFDLYGPVQVSKIAREYVSPSTPDTYIGEDGSTINVHAPGRMIEEAIKALDDQINYADYDSNGDGFVDFVYVFYAGKGDGTVSIWPHAYTLTSAIGAPVELDGVKINRYACSAEINYETNKLSGIGTFCHEFGHVLGLPDLYDTKKNGKVDAAFSPGTFSCMDGGNYNNEEHTPPFFSSYEQYSLEWFKPTTITGGADLTLLPLGARPFAYKIETVTNPQEYFLLEARDKYLQDYYLEGHGLAIWHIDFNKKDWDNNIVNTNDKRQKIDLIEADNDKTPTSRAGDLFPGNSGVCEFVEDVAPTFLDWNNKSTGYKITNIIRNFDGTVSFACESNSDLRMEGTEIETPILELLTTDADAITVRLKGGEDSDSYYISVYPIADFDGTFVTKYVEGFYYRPVSVENGIAEITIDGLTPGQRYGIMAYAANDVNATRTTTPLLASTVIDNFAEAVTNLYASADAATPESAVLFEWTPVKDATSYNLTVETRRAFVEETSETQETPIGSFDNKRMPAGWSGTGEYDNRTKYSGIDAPSYQLASNGAYLQTSTYDKEIKSVNFWCRQRYEDTRCRLEIHGIDKNGVVHLVRTVNNMSTTGENRTVEFPAGYYAAKFIYFFSSSGLDFNIDDIEVELADGFTATPVINVETAETVALVNGLEQNKEYVAYITPKNGAESGVRSEEVLFSIDNLPSRPVSSVEAVEISGDNMIFSFCNGVIIPSSENPYDLYSIDGTCVCRGIKGEYSLPAHGLYIIRSATDSMKICW